MGKASYDCVSRFAVRRIFYKYFPWGDRFLWEWEGGGGGGRVWAGFGAFFLGGALLLHIDSVDRL